MFNKKDIMTHAWNTYRKLAGKWEFGVCLKKAWQAAKARKEQFALCVENIVRESEKAVCVAVRLVCPHTDQAIARNVWVPKSQITDGVLSSWIVKAKLADLRNSINYGAQVIVEGFVSAELSC